jgi:hypothetical protein
MRHSSGFSKCLSNPYTALGLGRYERGCFSFCEPAEATDRRAHLARTTIIGQTRVRPNAYFRGRP